MKKKTLRLLIISHMYPSFLLPRHGIFLCRQAGYLLQHDIECHFLIPRPWAPWPLYRISRWQNYGPANPLNTTLLFDMQSVPYVRFPGQWYRPYEARAMTKALCKAGIPWHGQQPFDAILATPMFPDAIAAVALKEALSLPLAALSLGSDILVYPQETPQLQAQLIGMLEKVDLPLGVSQAICRHLQSFGTCRRDPLCIYLGRDTTRFAPAQDKNEQRRKLGWDTNQVVVVYVGRLAPNKGTRELIQAFAPLLKQYPQLQLLCVGDGPSRPDFERLTHEMGHQDTVTLVGEQSPEHVPLFLQGADIFVFPSHSEGMPQAVLEAMNCGLAVVATDVGGIPEAVIHEKTGLLVKPRNAAQLRMAVERMIKDKDLRNHLALQGQRHVEIIFDAQSNAEKLAQALWSLVKK